MKEAGAATYNKNAFRSQSIGTYVDDIRIDVKKNIAKICRGNFACNFLLANTPNNMRWPPWSSSPPSGDQADSRRSVSRGGSLDTTNWEEYIEPRNLIPTVLLTTSTLILIHVYRNYLRRIPQVDNIQPGFFRKRSLFGRVTSVGDGDNFRLFHTPGGRLAGWGWFPGRRVPEKKEDLKFRTVRTTASLSKRRILRLLPFLLRWRPS
jgi:hypothetical protein